MITRADTRLTDELISRNEEAGYWPVPTLPELLEDNAREVGDREAFADARERITWGELHERARRVAAGLLGLGVGKGDVVGIQLPNRIDFVVALGAINQIGAVACPYDGSLREREIGFILRFSGAVATIVGPDARGFDHVGLMLRLAPDLPDLRHVIVTEDEASDGVVRFSDLQASALDAAVEDELRRRAPDAHDVNRLLFTSGSTGDPKGVLHTYATTIYGNYRQNEHMHVDEDSVLLLFLPAGLNWGMFQVLQTIIGRCRMVMMDAFEPEAVLETIAREGVTIIGTPPTGLIALLRHPGLADHRIDSLKVISTSGTSCPIEVLRRAREELGCPVMEGYGMTEVGWICATAAEDPPEVTVGTVGHPFEWMYVRLRDEDGNDVPAGETGEIAVGGPCVSLGYYRNDERNAESFTADGWFLTGDLGVIDPTGRLRIVGRSKDIIKHGGSSVFPREIEEVLYTHPRVHEVAVVGVPDEYFGENGCACVIPREGETLDFDEMVEFLRPHIAKYKLPQRLEIMERFPYTSTGKLQKHVLREWVLAREGTVVAR